MALNARPSRRDAVRGPTCRHKATGYVYAGDPAVGAYASTHVCSREHCIQDARDWVEVKTQLTSHHTLFPESPRPTS